VLNQGAVFLHLQEGGDVHALEGVGEGMRKRNEGITNGV
jgi:hypothetical protein